MVLGRHQLRDRSHDGVRVLLKIASPTAATIEDQALTQSDPHRYSAQPFPELEDPVVSVNGQRPDGNAGFARQIRHARFGTREGAPGGSALRRDRERAIGRQNFPGRFQRFQIALPPPNVDRVAELRRERVRQPTPLVGDEECWSYGNAPAQVAEYGSENGEIKKADVIAGHQGRALDW